MNDASFFHLGGAVVSDHGPLTLKTSRALAGFYDREAEVCRSQGATGAARLCACRARALERAAADAARWRRAAGWRDPEASDQWLASTPR